MNAKWKVIMARLNKDRNALRGTHHEGKNNDTIKFQNFRTPENFDVIYLKLKQKRPNFSVFRQKDANEIHVANIEDPDQTAPSLILVCTVCPDLSVRKLRVITVIYQYLDIGTLL